jgi:hypothetical protein
MKNTTIRGNRIHGNYYGIQTGAFNEGIDVVDVHYNVLYGNAHGDVSGQAGDHLNLYNNTVDGTVDCAGTTNNVARNNLYKTLTGTFTESCNLDIDAIATADTFTDYAGHDYSLKSTAAGAIDKGCDVSLTCDIAGTAVPQGPAPDIGAYEYAP